MHKVGIVRGSGLGPAEGHLFKKLSNHGFEPIGITTYDNPARQEIPLQLRLAKNFNTITKGKLGLALGVATRITGYNFNSYCFKVNNLKNLTIDLDVLHSADSWYPFTYQAVKTGIPTVTTEWENIPFIHEGRPYTKIKKYNREHVAHFIAITEKTRQMLITEGTDPNRISVIPSGIDCDMFKPATKDPAILKQFGLNDSALKILFVGRFVEEKGIFDLLNAFATIQKEGNLEVLIAGSGTPDMTQQIHKQITELNIKSKIKFLGSIKYAEMPKIHNIADIMCLPSAERKFWAEQFGNSLVEAMACGKPVVSTWSGSIPEVVKDHTTGLLVEQHNPKALAEALQEFTTNKQNREVYGANGRRWVLERFEANLVAGKIAEVYRKVIA